MLLRDWVREVIRPQSSLSRAEFPAGFVEASVDKLMKEVSGENANQTIDIYREIKSLLRQHF
jgi:nuclear pore complex protein Nup155